MKPSRFNHIIRRRGQPQVLYNSRLHRYLALDQVQAAIYGGLLVPITRNLINQKDPTVEALLTRLVGQGFMVDDTLNEQDEIEVLADLRRFDRRRLELWIQLTTRCHQGCPDCPHAHDPRDMEDEVQQRLEDFVSAQAPGLRELTVTWWGGEPLLAWPAAVRLGQQFSRMAGQHRFSYAARLVTSSSPHAVAAAAPAGLHGVYHSLSSLREPVANGGCAIFLATFASLAENGRALPAGARIRFIDGKDPPGVCRNLRGLCHAAPHFSDDEIEILRNLLRDGYVVENLPRPQAVACQAVELQSYIVDLNGTFYRCWLNVGDPSRAANPDPGEPLTPQTLRWLAWNPFKQTHCQRCNILPWCLGGCPAQPVGEECGHWRFALRELLKLGAQANDGGEA